jgi:hypothetical protein
MNVEKENSMKETTAGTAPFFIVSVVYSTPIRPPRKDGGIDAG